MSKITCLVLCLVAASISRVHAGEEEDKAAFREAIQPIIDECSKEHGVSTDEIQSAKTAGSADSIKPCFLGCLFKKAEVFNAKGEYDVDNALLKLKKFVPDDAKAAKFAEIGKKCASVNDKPVSDGEAGCERGARLAACFLENKGVVTGADTPTLRDNIKPVLEECLKQFPAVTNDDVNKATEAGDITKINPCFNGCVSKKVGFINEKGDYDLNTGLINLRKFVKDDEEYTKLEEVARECTSVKDTVTDGQAGCERATLLTACFLQHKSKVLI